MSDVIEINVETGEVTTREYTEQEIINRSNMQRPEEPFIEQLEQDPNKVSALVKLQSLGLTTDEAKAIVGL